MPTGYTVKIKDGISFEEFALECARAFGACATMRDTNNEIPKEFFPNPYHANRLAEALEELRVLDNLSETEIAAEAEFEYLEQKEQNKKNIKEKNELKRQYEEMLGRVLSWNPPTEDHIRLKEFMIKQIEESIDFDCYISPEKESYEDEVWKPANWFSRKRKNIVHDIKYHQDELVKEIMRVKERNRWLVDLRNSLKNEH